MLQRFAQLPAESELAITKAGDFVGSFLFFLIRQLLQAFLPLSDRASDAHSPKDDPHFLVGMSLAAGA
jgi:hypothetical protein